MSLIRRERLRYVKGEIADLVVVQGIVYLKIGGYPLCLTQQRLARKWRNRNEVEALLWEPEEADGPSTVLAWQRRAQQRLHYEGPRVPAAVLFSALVLSGIGWLVHDAVVVAGMAIVLLELGLLARKWWVLRAFDAQRRLVSSTSEAPSEASFTPAAVPLDVRINAAASTQALSAASWSGEILEFTHDAIIIWEMDGAGIVYWNRAAERLYGYSRDEAFGRVTHELLKTELAGGVGELETKLARYGVWVGELRHTRSDGRRVEVEGRLSLMSQPHRPWLVLEVNRDVTDRNNAEAARLSMERQLKRLHGRVTE
jgi:PAS domain S-box-containing protein